MIIHLLIGDGVTWNVWLLFRREHGSVLSLHGHLAHRGRGVLVGVSGLRIRSIRVLWWVVGGRRLCGVVLWLLSVVGRRELSCVHSGGHILHLVVDG